MKEVKPPYTTFARELINDKGFWNPVPNAIDLYTPMDVYVMIRLK